MYIAPSRGQIDKKSTVLRNDYSASKISVGEQNIGQYALPASAHSVTDTYNNILTRTNTLSISYLKTPLIRPKIYLQSLQHKRYLAWSRQFPARKSFFSLFNSLELLKAPSLEQLAYACLLLLS